MTRRKFSREFKIEAVRLVTDRDVTVAQAARDLDIAESVLRRWMRELTARRHAPRPSEDIAAESRRPSLMPYPVHGAPHPLRPGQFQGRLQRCPLSVTSPLRGLAPPSA